MKNKKERVVELILSENQFLETERLVLRPIRLSDAQDMFEYASDDEVAKFVFEPHTSLENTREIIAQFFLPNTLGKYAIVWKGTNQMIGTIDFHHLDKENKKVEIGYTLSKKFWGRGIMPEAAEKLLWLAFEQLEFNVVYGLYDINNPRSGRVMEKIGMEPVGLFPRFLVNKGEAKDMMIYAITRESYGIN